MPFNATTGTYTFASVVGANQARLVGEKDGLKMFDLGAGVTLFVGGHEDYTLSGQTTPTPLNFSFFYNVRHTSSHDPYHDQDMDVYLTYLNTLDSPDCLLVLEFLVESDDRLSEYHTGELVDAMIALLRRVPITNSGGFRHPILVNAASQITHEQNNMIIEHIVELVENTDATDVERALVFLTENNIKAVMSAKEILSIHRQNHVVEKLAEEKVSPNGFSSLSFFALISPLFGSLGSLAPAAGYAFNSENYSLFFELGERIDRCAQFEGVKTGRSITDTGKTAVDRAKIGALCVLEDYLLEQTSETFNNPPVKDFVASKAMNLTGEQLYLLLKRYPFGTTKQSFKRIVNNFLAGKLVYTDNDGFSFLSEREYERIFLLFDSLNESFGEIGPNCGWFNVSDFMDNNRGQVKWLLSGLMNASDEVAIQALTIATRVDHGGEKISNENIALLAALLEKYVEGGSDLPFDWYARLGGVS